MAHDYSWIKFYSEFADRLLTFRSNRAALIEKIKRSFETIQFKLPTLEQNNEIVDIDPFTVFGLFNKGITGDKRIKIARQLAFELGVHTEVPDSFDGIPLVNNQKATYYQFKDSRQDDDIENLWEVFEQALAYADAPDKHNEQLLIQSFNTAIRQYGVKWNLTMGLFWIRPNTYLNLDKTNRTYLNDEKNIPSEFIAFTEGLSDNRVPDGLKYLQICDYCRFLLRLSSYEYRTFPELSYTAWITTGNKEPESDQE